MALFQFPLPSTIGCSTTRILQLPSAPPKFCVFSSMANGTEVAGKGSGQPAIRRSANYQPPLWKYEFVQSLTSEFMEETYISKIDMLKKAVLVMLNRQFGQDSLKQLELIDTLQRLGLSYHFEKEIKKILENFNQRFHEKANMVWKKNNLYATALEFRILRQHGYHIPQDVFNGFKDEMENFSECVCEDENAKGMLSLYEASYLAREGERVLDEAREFAVKHLVEYIKSSRDEVMSAMVSHALELPVHWRMPRLETRWFIDIYEKREDMMNPILLELAKLDFNFVQSTHQQELKYVSSWWRSVGLGEKLGFARDRLMTNFLWTVGMGFEPQFGNCRRMSTKITSLITTIDDVYDVYGTLDELELFTNAVERWDVDAIDSLPDYMKMCFLALHNTINDMAFQTLKDQGVNVIPYLRKMWADLCKTFLIEAKWYYTNYKPSFKEYLDNAWISVSGPLILVHAYIFAKSPITKEALEFLKDYPHIIQHSSIIFRLTNDLATSSDEVQRGDVSKSIQCYMNDTCASEDEARIYIKDLIIESWKKLNRFQAYDSSSYLSQTFIEIALNLARISHTVYQHRDGHTVEGHETKDRVSSLFIKPIDSYLYKM